MANAMGASSDAIALSPEFLAGTTKDGLEKIRTRLLDLTNRNRLLNYHHRPTSALRFVDTDLDWAFASLIDGCKVTVEPVPEPGEEAFISVDDASVPQKPDAKSFAESLQWNTALDSLTAQRQGSFRVLHYAEQLQTLTRKISSTARTAIEESGTNMLYLAFGFLEWYESDDSDQLHLSPLLMAPVGVDRFRKGGMPFEATIEYSDEEITSNLSLLEKLRQDFGLELPLWEEDELPKQYLGRVGQLLQFKKRWSIRGYLTLGLFSFGKQLMYRDLDPKTWPQESLLNHQLVRQLFEGSKQTEVSHAEEYFIDDLDPGESVTDLIRDADSSQHSALIDALAGRNLAIEGPPGTGKSQTISNLIAAALSRGKNVLFVAEKLAALEVVRQRLDQAGLGIFCLELHSHKTKKNELLRDVEARIERLGSFPGAADLSGKHVLLGEKRSQLNRYAGVINSLFKPLGRSVFAILWARDRFAAQLAADQVDLLKQIVLPSAVGATDEGLARLEHFVDLYSRHLKGIIGARRSALEHRWSWVRNGSMGFADETELLDSLHSFVDLADEATSLSERLFAECGHTLTVSPRGFHDASYLLASLPSDGTCGDVSLLQACLDAHTRAELSRFVDLTEGLRADLKVINEAMRGPVSPAWTRSLRMNAAQAIADLRQVGLQEKTLSEIRELVRRARGLDQLLDAAERESAYLSGLLGITDAASFDFIERAFRCLRLAAAAPVAALHLRRKELWQEGAGEMLAAASEEAKEIARLGARLATRLDVRLIDDPAVLHSHAQALISATFWERLVGRSYRNAKAAYRGVAKSRRKRRDMAIDFEDLAHYHRRRAAFLQIAEVRAVLGNYFRGTDSNWQPWLDLHTWYQQIAADLPLRDPSRPDVFRRFLTEGSKDAIVSIMTVLQPARRPFERREQTVLATLQELTAFQPAASFDPTEHISRVRTRLQAFSNLASSFLVSLDHLEVKDTLPIESIPGLLEAGDRIEEAQAELAGCRQAINALGSRFHGTDTSASEIREAVQFATEIASLVSRDTATWLLHVECAERLSHFRGLLKTAAGIGARTLQTCSVIDRLSASSKGSDLAAGLYREMRETASELLRGHEELPEWLQFLRHREGARTQGLDPITSLADKGTLSPPKLLDAFRFAFFNSLCRAIFHEYPELTFFSGLTQEEVKRQFITLDRETIELTRLKIAHCVDGRRAEPGRSWGPVKHWTNLSLIRHEISKQKRHIPIRQLLLRAGMALQALKPCFMMGPLSVAQYLAPGNLKFDLVIMDEASQLKPEDAIGAIARGSQLVVVGDPKQLPPTSFFQRLVDDEAEEDQQDVTAVQEGESILDVAMTLYQPVRRLRWHYRSRHHSLIAFSNNEFYQGKLVVFPSAFRDRADLGIRYYQTAGVYENRRNAREAEAVVNAFLEHVREHPDESLGIVALNFEQRELIDELLDQRLRTEPFAQTYIERLNSGPEPVFVKNLENVQGDERDVIFISCTYGPDGRGNQYQRFGPINGANGHRRLNVLFTRAKKRVEVFSSLDPEKIKIDEHTAWGVRALKNYLQFAKSGHFEKSEESSREPESDFERAVAGVLRARGYQVVPQVGVTGFFIDIGVIHPYKPGAFLLGIECDGASYHSARSARDRDRLRQEILENLGWRIYRIWSTDWFKSRDKEIERLASHIHTLVEQDPDVCRERERIRRTATLRDRLIEFRESTIDPEFPDSPGGSCLLRDQLLEEFVRCRPTSRDEWFKRIPQELRSATEGKQIARFLERVLAMISETA